MTSFFDQYKTPQWQKRRLEMLDGAEWQCSVCGTKDEQLHVHHISYVSGRKVWDYADDELAVLCDSCHETVHAFQGEIAPLVVQLNRDEMARLAGYLIGMVSAKLFERGKATRICFEHDRAARGVADYFGIGVTDVENAMSSGTVFIEELMCAASIDGGEQ